MSIETIEAVIDSPYHIKFHQKDKFSDSGMKFLVASGVEAKVGDKRENISIKGYMNEIIFGWKYRFYGHMTEDARYGKVFQFASFEPIVKSDKRGLSKYLQSYIRFLGPERADQIVEHFGEKTLEILRTQPYRVTEIKGLGKSVAESVRRFFEEDPVVDPVAYADVYELLSPIKPPKKIILSLVRNFGPSAGDFIRKNPYRLLDYPGLGWDRVDSLAIKHMKYKPKGRERMCAAVLESLARMENEGHTFATLDSLTSDASMLIGATIGEDVIAEMEETKDVIIEKIDKYSIVSDPSLRKDESDIAFHLARIAANAKALEFEIPTDGLDDEQRAAVGVIQSNGVAILSGIPGSGKSYITVRSVIAGCYRNGMREIKVCAPTGKAAQRCMELINEFMPGIRIPCRTIHSTLGVVPSEEEEGIPESESKVNRGRSKFSFKHGIDNPIDAEFIVLDEVSMADVPLFAAFLRAVPDGCRLLIVGDHNQLPSVGPGSVLRDMIAGRVPAWILDEPRRNSGMIAFACRDIKNGKMPKYADKMDRESGKNWMHLEVEDDEAILETIAMIHEESIKYMCKLRGAKTADEIGEIVDATKWRMQVISPEKKKILGCNSLNARLARSLNPEHHGHDEPGIVPLMPGDKVVRTENGYGDLLVAVDEDCNEGGISEKKEEELRYILGDDRFEEFESKVIGGECRVVAIPGLGDHYMVKAQLVNGDIGEIARTPLDLVPRGGLLVSLKIPDRLFLLNATKANVILAYATTVHKMQGSSAPCIITPLADFYWNPRTKTGLYHRELVYTMISRPTEELITVGRIRELEKAISRKTVSNRRTLLRKFLKEVKYVDNHSN